MRPIRELRHRAGGMILGHQKDWKISLAYLGPSKDPKEYQTCPEMIIVVLEKRILWKLEK